ncbi:methionyl-tRNA formyltransferase [Halotalea alkalilenta]|uniref:methionyl-tRNA formyltransferase n=1 Tax=Halotalea alkalilenta TaxID=376489 RepID=UPI0004860EBC|nr:methionyl-tRNA formyltransferase [Halotalea alkalilenta]
MPVSLRVGFAGTPDFAAAILEALLASRHQVVCVYTQPDRPAGRGRKPQSSPVKLLAERHGLPVHQPERLNSEESRAALVEARLDVLVVAAYGLILPREVLEIARLGALNVHASLLPRWRGAAPIQRAIEAGDTESGVTIMAMDEGLDTGDMLLERRVAIDAQTTGGALHDALAVLGAEAIVSALDTLADDPARLPPRPQPAQGVSYAAKLSKAQARLDFDQPAERLAAKVRAFNPWPVAWAELDGEPLRIWAAEAEPQSASQAAPGTLLESDGESLLIACASGQLRVLRAQLPGGKPLSLRELLNSRAERFLPGKRFAPLEPSA